MATLLHEVRFGCQELMILCDLTSSAATLSHEIRFESQKLLFFSRFDILGGNPFARNEVPVSKPDFFANLVGPVATLSHEIMFECQKLMFFLDFILSDNLFARNEVRVLKTEGFCAKGSVCTSVFV